MRLRFAHLESLYLRMFIVICAAVIPTFLGLSFYVYLQHDYSVKDAEETTLRFTNLTAHDEGWLFNSTQVLLQSIASTPIIQSREVPECHEFLANLLKNQTTYVNFGVIDANGDAVCEGIRNANAVHTNFADRGYFRQAIATKGPVVGEYQVGRLSGQQMIMVAMPLTNPKHEINGVLYAALNLDSIAHNRHEVQLAHDAHVAILDRNGTVLNTIPETSGTTGTTLSDANILALTKEKSPGAAIITLQDGKSWLVSHSFAGFDNDPQALTVIYRQPVNSLLDATNKSFWLSVLATMGLAAIALLIGWWGVQALVGRNMRHLTAAAKRYRERQFDTRIENVLSGTEFKEIGRRFDAMASELGKQQLQWAASIQHQKGRNRILRMILYNTNLNDTLAELARFAEQQNADTVASFILLTPDGNQIESCIAPNLPKRYTNILIESPDGHDIGSWGEAMREKRVVVVSDINSSPHWTNHKDLIPGSGLQSCWSHPIVSPDERVLGSLTIFGKELRGPTLEEQQSAQVAAGLAAVAIEHSRQSCTLRYQSQHDMLTGLYNRASLLPSIAQAIKNASTTHGQVTVFIVDLNGFKEINDTLGHSVGDNLLVQVSKRLRSIESIHGDIARSGGNEFTFVITDNCPVERIRKIAESTLGLLRQPYILDGIEVQISASAGVAQFPESGTDPNALMLQAGTAMRRAKREGSGYVMHDASQEDPEPGRLLMLSHLRKALTANEFILHYQPKLDLASDRITGFEALLRWQNPTSGLVHPQTFVPTLELSDLIHPVTLWVIESAVKQCKRWHEQGLDLVVAANVSARNLLDLRLPEKIEELLTRHDLAARFLEVEITESSLISDPDRSMEVLKRLHEIGIQISIDDFGTGYSSLAYLQKLPVDNVKIDRSFVVEINQKKGGRSIVSSIITLAHNLGLTVTAEGVEHDSLLKLLRYLGCDYAQGYHLGKPMAGDDVPAWLRTLYMQKTGS